MSIMECCGRVGISGHFRCQRGPISYPAIILGEKGGVAGSPLPHAPLESMFIHEGSLIRPICWYLRTNE